MSRAPFLLALLMLGCAEPPTEAAPAPPPEPPVEPAPAPAPAWAEVRREDGRVELRSGGPGTWLVLRRLEASPWVRGAARGGLDREVHQVHRERRTGRPRHVRRPLALVQRNRPGSRFSRFWVHAQALRDMPHDGGVLRISGIVPGRERLDAFLEGLEETDGSLFEGIEAPGTDYAIVVKTPRPRGPASWCEARVAFPLDSDDALVSVRGHVGGTGGRLLVVRCPDAPGWLEVGRRRVELPEASSDFYGTSDARRRQFPTCPSRVPVRELVRHARHPGLRVCGSSCCYDADDAFREALRAAPQRLRALAESVAERPSIRALGPSPRGPGAER